MRLSLRHGRRLVTVALSLAVLVTAAGWQRGEASAEGEPLRISHQACETRQTGDLDGESAPNAARRAQHDPTVVGVVRGHTGWVGSVTFHPGGGVLVTGSADGTAVLWDITDPAHPRELAVLEAHAGWVNSVAFDPHGRVLASASGDRTVMLWDVDDPASPLQLRVLDAHTNYVSSVAFHPDGEFMASSSRDATVALWDVSDPARAFRWCVLQGRIYWFNVAFDATGGLLASGSGDRTAVLWDVRTLPQRSGRSSTPFSPRGHPAPTRAIHPGQ